MLVDDSSHFMAVLRHASLLKKATSWHRHTAVKDNAQAKPSVLKSSTQTFHTQLW